MTPTTSTQAKQQRLAWLESRVDQWLAGSDDGENALLSIRREKLYQLTTAGEWKDYIKLRWPNNRHQRTIYKQLTHIEVVTSVLAADIEEGAPEPNERQSRELTRGLVGRPDAQRQVWLSVVEECRAEGRPITSHAVRGAVVAFLEAERDDDPTYEQVRDAEERVKRRARSVSESEAITRFEEDVRKSWRRFERKFRTLDRIGDVRDACESLLAAAKGAVARLG